MKRLANPKWIHLVKDLSAEDCKAILLAILEYPDRECRVPGWSFIQAELDEDEEKYRVKCRRLAENRQARWAEQTPSEINQSSTDFRKKSSDITAIANSIEHNQNNKTMHSNSRAADALINKFASNFNPNKPVKYLINDTFNFGRIAERNPAFDEMLKLFPIQKRIAAEVSLIEKCFGEEKTVKQIIGWLENEGNFKNSNRI